MKPVITTMMISFLGKPELKPIITILSRKRIELILLEAIGLKSPLLIQLILIR